MNAVITILLSFTEAEYPAITLKPKEFITPCTIIFPTDTKLCCNMLGTATADTFTKSSRENSEGFESTGIVRSLRNISSVARAQLIP